MSSSPAGSRPGDAQREAPHLERSRGDDASVWIGRACCALSDSGSSFASRPPERSRHPGGSAAGASGSFASGDDRLNVESRRASAGREVSARWSRTHPSIPHPRCLQLRRDDGESGGSGDRADRAPSARTCG